MWRPRSIILLLLAVSVQSQYLARTSTNALYASLCVGANNPDVCLGFHFKYVILRTFTADCSDLAFYGDCRATVVVGTDEAVIGLFFRGPASITNFVANFKTVLPNMPLEPFEGNGKVGLDYQKAFDRLWNTQGLGTYMQEIWAQYCDFTLLVSGHSLGSCLAQMGAVATRKKKLWKAAKIVYYGYGTPRCGDMDFAFTMNAAAVNRFRVNWLNDMVPSLPATTCDRTVDPTWQKQTCWFHCCGAATFKAGFLGFNSWVFCDIGESTSCNLGTGTSDHTTYWKTVTGNYQNLVCSAKIFTPA